MIRRNILLSIALSFSQLLVMSSVSAQTDQKNATGQNSIDLTQMLSKLKKQTAQSTLSKAQLDAAIVEIERLAQKQVDEQIIPGLAIAIVHEDKVVFAKGFGLRQSGHPEKIDAETVFQLASVSKPMASTVVAALVSDGKVSWDSKISKLDPQFSLHDPWVTSELTIRDLFAHRSGLPEHAGDLLEDLGYDRAQVLQRLRYQKPESSFRAAYLYTNFGLTEAAVAAADAYKLSWEDACETKLYKPLGMRSTSSRYADFVANSNKAVSHVLVNGKWEHKFERNPDAQSPAGGVSSSVSDLAKWLRLQLASGKFEGKQIAAEDALVETHHPQILTHFSPLGNPEFYGLGLNVHYDPKGRLRLSHSGGFSRGVATTISMIPSESLGICVLTNAYPVGVAEGLAARFTDLALEGKPSLDWLALFKKVFADPATLGVSKGADYNKTPAVPTAALKNSAYMGKYHNDFFGDLQIVERNGSLELEIGPEKTAFAMRHYDRDIFTIENDSENSSGTGGLTFTVAANGQARNVLVENLNVAGEGLFVHEGNEK